MSWCCSCVLFVSPYYSASFIGEELADTELSAWSLHTHGLQSLKICASVYAHCCWVITCALIKMAAIARYSTSTCAYSLPARRFISVTSASSAPLLFRGSDKPSKSQSTVLSRGQEMFQLEG